MNASRFRNNPWPRLLRNMLPVALALTLGLVILASALGQRGGGTASARGLGYDLTWWAVDGGGDTFSGGGYALMGTGGQPEPGPPLTGGGYSLSGGFWSVGGSAPTPADTPTPTLTATATGLPKATATRTVTRTLTPTATGPATVTPTATLRTSFRVYLPVIQRDWPM